MPRRWISISVNSVDADAPVGSPSEPVVDTTFVTVKLPTSQQVAAKRHAMSDEELQELRDAVDSKKLTITPQD